MIVIWHVYCHFLVKCHETPTVTQSMFALSIFLPMHVDLFVLISGYFGIKHILKKLIDTYLVMVFYLLVIAVLFWSFDWQMIFLPFSHGPWWFMRTYVYLLLLAPILNFVSDTMAKSYGWKAILIPILVLNEYFSFTWHDLYLGHFGFDLLNFVTVYFLGRYLASESFERWCCFHLYKKNRPWLSWLIIFLIVQIIRLIYYQVVSGLGINTHNWDYNNPLNIISAITFFQLLRNVSVSGNWVYFFSSSAVAVYLVTEHPYVLPKLEAMFFLLYGKISATSTIGGLLYCFLFAFLSYLAVALFDKLRIPVQTCISGQILPHVNK